jgi:hypothetical protein
MSWRSNLRQLQYPREFRIPAAAWSADLRGQLVEIAALLQKPHQGQDGPGPKILSDLGTGLWRLRSRMIQPETGRPLEGMGRAYRHFESVWDALHGEGIKIYDHTGEAFEPGRALQVMSFQPTPALTRDVIIETIKPTIYFKDTLIQTGEVIVGTPEGLSKGH